MVSEAGADRRRRCGDATAVDILGSTGLQRKETGMLDPTQHGLVWLARETRENPLSETRKSRVVLFERARDETPFLDLMETVYEENE